jgi:hypothetical protein
VLFALYCLARFVGFGERVVRWSGRATARAKAYAEFVSRLRAVCASGAFECAIVLFSTKSDDGFGTVGAALAREEWPIVDLSDLKDVFTREAFDAGPYDPHPSAAVHRRIADGLAPFILARRATRAERP